MLLSRATRSFLLPAPTRAHLRCWLLRDRTIVPQGVGRERERESAACAHASSFLGSPPSRFLSVRHNRYYYCPRSPFACKKGGRCRPQFTTVCLGRCRYRCFFLLLYARGSLFVRPKIRELGKKWRGKWGWQFYVRWRAGEKASFGIGQPVAVFDKLEYCFVFSSCFGFAKRGECARPRTQDSVYLSNSHTSAACAF